MKPPKYKHFSKGNKYHNALLTQIGVGWSSLHKHKFIIGLSETSECLCHHEEETRQHFFS